MNDVLDRREADTACLRYNLNTCIFTGKIETLQSRQLVDDEI